MQSQSLLRLQVLLLTLPLGELLLKRRDAGALGEDTGSRRGPVGSVTGGGCGEQRGSFRDFALPLSSVTNGA